MSDLISRQAAIYAAKNLKVDEEYCEYDDGFNDGISEVVKMLYSFPSAESQRYMVTMPESTDIDRLKEIIMKSSDITLIPFPKVEPESCEYWDAESKYCALNRPSAEPDGRWEIIHPGETGYSAGDFRCSVCGQPNRCYHLTKYCCNCGARMVNRGKVKKEKR